MIFKELSKIWQKRIQDLLEFSCALFRSHHLTINFPGLRCGVASSSSSMLFHPPASLSEVVARSLTPKTNFNLETRLEIIFLTSFGNPAFKSVNFNSDTTTQTQLLNANSVQGYWIDVNTKRTLIKVVSLFSLNSLKDL